MATARIAATVTIDLEGTERYPATSHDGLPIVRDGHRWIVDGFAIDHPDAEYVRPTIHLEGDESDSSVLGPVLATRLPQHVQPLLRSARLTLAVIAQLQGVTASAVGR